MFSRIPNQNQTTLLSELSAARSRIQETGMSVLTPAHHGVTTDQIEELEALAVPMARPDVYSPTLNRDRAIARCIVDRDGRIEPEPGVNTFDGLYYGYQLSAVDNPEQGGAMRWFPALDRLQNGSPFWDHSATVGLVGMLIGVQRTAPQYLVEMQLIVYRPTASQPSLVTPNTAHFDGLGQETQSAVLVIGRQNTSGGRFYVADGEMVGRPIEEIPAGSVHYLDSPGVGHGVVLDEVARSDRSALVHGATPTLIGPEGRPARRTILVTETTPID